MAVNVPAELSALLGDGLFESLTLLAPDELSEHERALIPDWWVEAARLPGRVGLQRALHAWQPALRDALPAFQTLMWEHGIGVFVGRSASRHEPLLAYAAAPPSGDPICWYGFPPTPDLDRSALDLTGLPAGPRDMYGTIHDGFKLACGIHNGFPCSSELFAVGEDLDVESAEVIGSRPAPDLDRLVSLFYDYGASSICVELSTTASDDRDGWALSDGQLHHVDDIWRTIDGWMSSLTEP